MKKPDQKPLQIRDLPLPKEQTKALLNIAAAAAKQPRQLCLFVGPSGNGQTLVASVLANHLRRPLERLKLPALVAESSGETEKKLSALLEKAQSAQAVLFFDEADALFGKRGEVKDSHDRYANLEVSHLLDALAGYDGLVILSSNLSVADGAPLEGRPAHVLTFERRAG